MDSPASSSPAAGVPLSPGRTPLPVPSFATDAEEVTAVPVLAAGAGPASRRWWQRRRVWAGSAGAVIFTGVGLAMAVSGRQAKIIFINAGDDTLPPLTVTANGHTHSVPPLEARASYRWELPPGDGEAAETPVQVLAAVPDDAARWDWTGGVAPTGRGASLILRIHSGGLVEESTGSSAWYALFGN